MIESEPAPDRQTASSIQPDDLIARILIPAGLEEGAKRYIQSRKNEVPQLLQLLQVKEFGKLAMLAHNMKGTGTSYGFPDLTRLGALIENSARAEDGAVLSEQLLELSRYVQEAADSVAKL